MWYWYLIVSSLIFMWVAWKVPKPLPPLVYYATVANCLFIAEVTDVGQIDTAYMNSR